MKKNYSPKISLKILGALLLCATVTTLTIHTARASEPDSLQKQAEQGDIEAQGMLGFMYDYGIGIQKDDTEAARWYRMAAEQGLDVAQFSLGGMYASGESVLQDHTEAARWYRMAAEQGHTDAQFNLGFEYATGKGVPQDYVRAFAWWNILAVQCDEAALENLGIITKRMTSSAITEAKKLSHEYWEAYGPGRYSSE